MIDKDAEASQWSQNKIAGGSAGTGIRCVCRSSLEKKGRETGRCELKDIGEMQICSHRIMTNHHFKARSSTASQSDSLTEWTVLQNPEDMTEVQNLLDFDCTHLDVYSKRSKNEEKREETRYIRKSRGVLVYVKI